MAVSYHFFHVFSRRGAICNAATTGATYSWVSVVIMSAIKRYCRELSIGYSSLPKVGVVCEISSKEHKRPSSLLLKAQHVYILETKTLLVSAVLLIILHASLLYYCTRYMPWWVRGWLLVAGWYTCLLYTSDAADE